MIAWLVRASYGMRVANALRIVRLIGLSARLTRLAHEDTITDPARQALITRVEFQPHQREALDAGIDVPPPTSVRSARARAWLVELLSCRWCLAVWITAGVTLADVYWGRTRWYRASADAALAAYCVGWLAEHERN